MLAKQVGQHQEVKGIKYQGKSHKILLYAVNIGFVLQDPVNSIQRLSKILLSFGEVSGYKINNSVYNDGLECGSTEERADRTNS